VADAGLADAGGGPGRPTRQPLLLAPHLSWLGSPVDHVAVSPDVAVLRYGVGADIGSDHLPVIVEVRLPGPGRR
jgi:endonuclease/exonuclease/phosphatase (EEP) superfamily protein YafD